MTNAHRTLHHFIAVLTATPFAPRSAAGPPRRRRPPPPAGAGGASEDFRSRRFSIGELRGVFPSVSRRFIGVCRRGAGLSPREEHTPRAVRCLDLRHGRGTVTLPVGAGHQIGNSSPNRRAERASTSRPTGRRRGRRFLRRRLGGHQTLPTARHARIRSPINHLAVVRWAANRAGVRSAVVAPPGLLAVLTRCRQSWRK